MKKLFLHIGLPKTGSTTIQAFLQQNKDNLLKFGYLYPQAGLVSHRNAHHNLAQLLIDLRKFNPDYGTWQELHEEIENSKIEKIIISSEDFTDAKEKQIESLKKELKPYDVKIIVYLRRQDLRIESLYTQMIKTGSWSKDKVGDISSFAEKMTRRKTHDYYQLLEPWKEAFGSSSVIVRPLEKCQIPNLCFDILKSVGINDFKYFREVHSKNVKPDRKSLELLKIASEIYLNDRTKSQDLDEYKKPKIRKKYLKQITDYAKIFWSQEDSKYRLLSYIDSVKILERYYESNQAVAREYLDREDGILFYEQLEKYETDNFTIEDLSKEELLHFILYVHYENFKYKSSEKVTKKEKLELIKSDY